MPKSKLKISFVILLGAALIAGVLILQSPTNITPSTEQNVAVVTTAPDRIAIQTFDVDHDGIPDWQEALVHNQAITLSKEEISYQKPKTLTEQFALDLFKDMVRAENYGDFGQTPEELVSQASDSLVQHVQDTLFTELDIVISKDISIDALIKYGEQIAYITTLYQDDVYENEAIILERALREQSYGELKALDQKITFYKNTIRATKELPVPSILKMEHLNLLNSYNAILSAIIAMRDSFSDPVMSLLRMKRYQDDVLGLSKSIENLYNTLLNNGATWSNHSVVFTLIKLQ